MLLYRLLSIVLYPIIELYLIFRVYKKKEDKNRLKERFGKPTQERPQGLVFWIHAVSVGETNSSFVLVDEILQKLPEVTVLFTTTTVTSAATVAAKLPEFSGRVIHQYLPVDSLFCVRSFLQYWQPCASLFVESEVWPNLIAESRALGSLVFLINARISQKSANKWNIATALGFNIFDYFNQIFAQSLEDQKRFAALTKNQVLFLGNLKSQARDLSCNFEQLQILQEQIANRKFWLAASTHKGEEEIVIAAHRELKKEFPDLLTILVPRHPNRANEIKNLIGDLPFSQRSQNSAITQSTELYLADTLGELGTFYRLSNFAFLGGSLIEVGGHNPYEPIKLNCAVISGRHVFNFKEVYQKLETTQACVMIESIADLTAQVSAFLRDEKSSEAIANKAKDLVDTTENIAAAVVDQIILSFPEDEEEVVETTEIEQ